MIVQQDWIARSMSKLLDFDLNKIIVMRADHKIEKKKEEIPENFENFLDENDIEYLEGLTNEIEENLGEIKEVLGANMIEDCAYNN